jgi:hypothetical protein
LQPNICLIADFAYPDSIGRLYEYWNPWLTGRERPQAPMQDGQIDETQQQKYEL